MRLTRLPAALISALLLAGAASCATAIQGSGTIDPGQFDRLTRVSPHGSVPSVLFRRPIRQRWWQQARAELPAPLRT